MSDNLPPEVVQEELEARFRIPTEVWTDVFKLLPRRVLVTQIAPVCYYFKEISNKNVKNVHVIENAEEFTDKLDTDDPEAKKQLEHLAANECQLAGQFKLSEIWIGEKSQSIMRHCSDLFNGCTIEFDCNAENNDSTVFLECLAELEKAKPVMITVEQDVDVDQVIDYWHHPTFLNCSRIDLSFWSGLSAATMMNIVDWLHHQPNGVMDCDGPTDQQVRCMIFWGWGNVNNHIELLINRCAENIQQVRGPADRRPYVLSFSTRLWDGQFRRIENNLTGEILVLDRVTSANGQTTGQFRLRRCLTEEETNGEDFYAGVFKRYRGYELFEIGENKPRVMIE